MEVFTWKDTDILNNLRALNYLLLDFVWIELYGL